MEYQIADAGSTTEIALSGRLEFGDHRKFRELTEKLADRPTQKFNVNLSRLDFIDSSGLGMLIAIRNLAHRRKIDMVLSKPSATVRRILDTAQFSAIAPIED